MLVRLKAHCHPTILTLQLVIGYEPNVFHIYAFGCAFHMPSCAAATYQHGFSKKNVYLLSIMILLHTSSLRALARDLFTAHLWVCHFNETVFPPLGGDKNVNVPKERREFVWTLPTMSHLDPHTAQV